MLNVMKSKAVLVLIVASLMVVVVGNPAKEFRGVSVSKRTPSLMLPADKQSEVFQCAMKGLTFIDRQTAIVMLDSFDANARQLVCRLLLESKNKGSKIGQSGTQHELTTEEITQVSKIVLAASDRQRTVLKKMMREMFLSGSDVRPLALSSLALH